MSDRVPSRLRAGTAAAGTLLASVGLAVLAQRPAATPGVLDALAPVLAIAAYVGGMTAACAVLFALRARGAVATSAVWVALLVAARLVVEPGLAVASVGSAHELLLERWTALSNSMLWFVAVPLEVVFGAAACGGVLAALALATGDDARATPAPVAGWSLSR